MTTQIVRLYPSNLGAHAAPRSFAEVVKQKLAAGTMTPGGAVAAFVVCQGIGRREACDRVAVLLREIANG